MKFSIKYFYRNNVFLITFIILFSFCLLSQNIKEPFWEHHSWNNNAWSVIAKNNLNYGFTCTKFGQAISGKPITNCNELEFYMNHPPFITWLVTASYFIFGISEASARLPFILFSTGSAILIFLIGSKMKTKTIGFWASLFFILNPMFIYFGKSMNHEPVTLFFILFSMYSYLFWIKNKQKKYFYRFLLGAFLTGITGWHGYLFFPLLVLATFFINPKKTKKVSLSLIILFSTFILHILHSLLIQGNFYHDLITKLLFYTRVSGTELSNIPEQTSFFSQFMNKELHWLVAYYTRFLFISGLIVLFLIIFNLLKNKRITQNTLIITTLFFFGLLIPLIFSQQTYIHDYLNFYLLPFFALSGALVSDAFTKLLPKIFKFLPLLFLTLVLFERKPFLDELQHGTPAKQYVELANEIKKRATSNEKFLIEASEFEGGYPFLNNYAYGVWVDYDSENLESFSIKENDYRSNYHFIITVKTNPVDELLTSYLEEVYSKEIINGFNFYKISK